MERAPIVLWRPTGPLGAAVTCALAGLGPLVVVPGDEQVAAAAAAAGAAVAPAGGSAAGATLEAAVERWGAPAAAVVLPGAVASAPFQEVARASWEAIASELEHTALMLRAILPLALAAPAPRVVLLLPPDLPPARFQRAGRVAGAVLRAGLEALVQGLCEETRGQGIWWLRATLAADDPAAAAQRARHLVVCTDPAALGAALLT